MRNFFTSAVVAFLAYIGVNVLWVIFCGAEMTEDQQDWRFIALIVVPALAGITTYLDGQSKQRQ